MRYIKCGHCGWVATGPDTTDAERELQKMKERQAAETILPADDDDVDLSDRFIRDDDPLERE